MLFLILCIGRHSSNQGFLMLVGSWLKLVSWHNLRSLSLCAGFHSSKYRQILYLLGFCVPSLSLLVSYSLSITFPWFYVAYIYLVLVTHLFYPYIQTINPLNSGGAKRTWPEVKEVKCVIRQIC